MIVVSVFLLVVGNFVFNLVGIEGYLLGGVFFLVRVGLVFIGWLFVFLLVRLFFL